MPRLGGAHVCTDDTNARTTPFPGLVQVQKFVQQVQAQAKFIGRTPKEVKEDEERRAARAAAKKEKENLDLMMNTLFRPVQSAQVRTAPHRIASTQPGVRAFIPENILHEKAAAVLAFFVEFNRHRMFSDIDRSGR